MAVQAAVAKKLLKNKKVQAAIATLPLLALALLVGLVAIVASAMSAGAEEASDSYQCPSIAANGVAFATNGPINVGSTLTGRKGTTMTADMMFFSQVIVAKGQEMGITDRGLVISIATALQESVLKNLPGGDRDSVGLFQQRPSQGWGTVQQIMDPNYSAMKFFTALAKVADYDKLPLTVAAQKVQRSGFPDAYAKWEKDAAGIVESILSAQKTPVTATTPTTAAQAAPTESSNQADDTYDDIQNVDTGKCRNNIDTAVANYNGENGDTMGITGPVGIEQTTTVQGVRVNIIVASQVDAMFNAMKAAGLNPGGGGYRDPAGQIATRKNNCGTSNYAIYEMPAKECSPPTARPGRSMHERGLAIDMTCGGGAFSFKNSPCFPWMKANAATYGFFNLPSEPWHWSTNGN